MKNKENKKQLVDLSFATKIPIKLTSISATIFLLGGIGTAFYTNYAMTENRQKSLYLSEVTSLNERLGKVAPLARQGNESSYKELADIQQRLNKLSFVLKEGGELDGNFKITPLENTSDTKVIYDEWNRLDKYVTAIIEGRKDLASVKRLSEASLANMSVIEETSTNFYKEMSRRTGETATSQEFYLLYNRISQGIKSLFYGDEYKIEVGYNLAKDLKTFDALIDAYKNGSTVFNISPLRTAEMKEELRKLEAAYVPFRDFTLQLIPNIEQIETAKVLTSTLITNTENILKSASIAKNEIEELNLQLSLLNYVVYLLFVLSFLSAFLLALHFLEKEKKTAEMVVLLSKSQNNQAAIDMLKEQLKPIARRDFTHRVYISDEFVTQIAERIEKIRLSFSDVVRQMKHSAFHISQNADNTDNSSKKLVEVSNIQNSQLKISIDKINKLTDEIDAVAQETWFAERKSLEAATASKEGRILVKETIEKMNDIRKNIQESSKKIKKSSESAQAISVITELIKTMTKKIEVISLNAAIQAASSGEAGREFQVLAYEVQHLALESSESTSNILKLVQEVQQDIAAAVSAMEITTQEVVQGAKLSESAGATLSKTETLSSEVAEGIGKTTVDLEKKSEEMADMSVKMEELRQTTDNAKDIIQITVRQVESLNEIAHELTETVAEYKVEDQ